jgi:hypothetical protein
MIYLLSQLSSKNLNYTSYSRKDLECIQKLDICSEKYQSEEWVMTSKEILVDLVKNIEKDENFPTGIISNLGFGNNELAKEHVFASLIARWFNFNSNGLENYINLVNTYNKEEIYYQNFLKSNPYILEPFHAQIWSKPRFGEDYIPDFLIRSMDNSYTVVEIEKPDFQILTLNGELSAKTTHAKRQALDFRDWAISNKLYASQKFKDIHRPYCLVVIGRESELNDMQLMRLRQENESTQGILKIVGFDWLYQRAKATFNNILEFGFNKNTFRGTIDE